MLLGDEKTKLKWEEEAKMKAELAKRISVGRSKFGGNKAGCKIITVLLGDNEECWGDID
jgi:hypothetical protein